MNQLENGNILAGDVGSGKSLAAVAYYARKESPRPVYVITTAKKRDSGDWLREFSHAASLVEGGDFSHLENMVVDSWNNIGKYAEVEGAFFIFDEQRLVGAGAWTKAFYKIAKRNRWILLSATPGDTWMDYIPVFVANGFFKNKTEFMREHVVMNYFGKYPKLERYVGNGKLVRLRNKLLVQMPFQRHTTRRIEWLTMEYDSGALQRITKERWNIFENKPLKDVGEMFRSARRLVNSHGSRLQRLRELLYVHPRLIVFYNFDYELEILRGVFDDEQFRTDGACVYTLAEWNGHRHDAVPSGKEWVYLVQYTAGSEGWNCVTTDAMAFYSLPYSYKQWHQAYGRIDRLNTRYSELFYYVLTSQSWIDLSIRKALMAKKSFNEASMGVKF